MKPTNVDEYAASLTGWQAETIASLRQIIRAAAPKAVEVYKWAQPVYEANGPMIFIKAHRSHMNLGFWRGAELADPKGLFEGDGDRMRHIKLSSPADVNKSAITAFVKQAVKLNAEKGDPTKKK